jgi:hypothetical protein
VVTLEIWYDQTPDDDDHEGDPAIMVHTVQELDALVERVIAAGRGGTVAAMVEISVAGDSGSPTLEVGLGTTKGFIHYLARDADPWTAGGSTLTGDVLYDYMGSVQEVPAHVEVPIGVVREGLREFLASGRKPAAMA